MSKFSETIEPSTELIITTIYQNSSYAWFKRQLWREKVANTKIYKLNSK